MQESTHPNNRLFYLEVQNTNNRTIQIFISDTPDHVSSDNFKGLLLTKGLNKSVLIR